MTLETAPGFPFVITADPAPASGMVAVSVRFVDRSISEVTFVTQVSPLELESGPDKVLWAYIEQIADTYAEARSEALPAKLMGVLASSLLVAVRKATAP